MSEGTFAQAQEECTVTVQPGQSIQAAIDQAQEGAVICLAEGTWSENLKIEKSLTLKGIEAEKTVVKAVDKGYPVVWIESAEDIEARLENLALTGAVRYSEDQFCALLDPHHWICPNGLLVRGQARVTLINSQISNNGGDGLFAWDSAWVSLHDSHISANGWVGSG